MSAVVSVYDTFLFKITNPDTIPTCNLNHRGHRFRGRLVVEFGEPIYISQVRNTVYIYGFIYQFIVSTR